MNIAMKLESFGMSEIYNIIHSMFNDDEDDFSQRSGSNSYNDGWNIFETDILPMLQD